MGVLSFFKKKRKEEQFEEVVARYDDTAVRETKRDKGEIKKHLLDRCHEMQESATELNNAKKEYSSLTSYLTDIQTMENMDEEDHKKLVDISGSIIHLEDSKKTMQKKVNRLPDSKYYQLDRMKDDIPKDIARLKENEELQNLIKRDLDYLEGEKVEWVYEKGELQHEEKILKTVSRASMGVFALLVIGFVVGFVMEIKVLYSVLMVCMLVTGLVVCGILIRLQNIKTQIRRCTLNYNRAVNIQNSVKLRYVNMKNAVDYTCERYGVGSARELEKNWQLYLEAVKEREKLLQADDDLSYFKDSLLNLLNQYNMYDAGIWLYQVHAIVDPREMVEVKHMLIERRQKVRSRMENAMQSIKELKKEVLAVAKQNRVYPEEMKGILEEIQALMN